MIGLAKRIVFLAMALAGTLAAGALAQEKEKAQKEADETLSAIVRVKSRIIKDARSAETLGLQRDGSGVLIRDGYVLTIGYLVIEAESIEVSGPDGNAVPATVAGYDHASGFGLLKLLAPFAGKPLPLGNASALEERAAAMIASHGGRDGVNLVYVVSRRPFTGSWEYLLDSAIFTYPAVMNWSGAALISAKGELLGIGSLIVNDSAGAGSQSPGNMFVPIDLLKPILAEMIATGRQKGGARPWLGMSSIEDDGHLKVLRVNSDGPAEKAGIEPGDVILALSGVKVEKLDEFYRRLWASGAPGVDVTLKVLKGAEVREIRVHTMDRLEHIRKKPTI